MSSISFPSLHSSFLISSTLPPFTYWKTHLFLSIRPSLAVFLKPKCANWDCRHLGPMSMLSLWVCLCVCVSIPGRLSALKQKLSVNLVCIYICLLNPAPCIFPSSCVGLNPFKRRQHISPTCVNIFLELFFMYVFRSVSILHKDTGSCHFILQRQSIDSTLSNVCICENW